MSAPPPVIHVPHAVYIQLFHSRTPVTVRFNPTAEAWARVPAAGNTVEFQVGDMETVRLRATVLKRVPPRPGSGPAVAAAIVRVEHPRLAETLTRPEGGQP